LLTDPGKVRILFSGEIEALEVVVEPQDVPRVAQYDRGFRAGERPGRVDPNVVFSFGHEDSYWRFFANVDDASQLPFG
jgi:hypothetical protein